MHASNGILFNHESPRRGETFVTRKITRAIAAIVHKQQQCVHLGNLDAKRDWGYAAEYTEAMRLMLQQPSPDDFVIATGRTSTVREFAELAFARAGIELVWKGEGVDEVGVDAATGIERVRIDPAYFRPTEVDLLLGDPSKARELLGWSATTSLETLVHLMVDADMAAGGTLSQGVS
ncbi:MAG: GDP-mannose 4,6-dehydratase, partial [Deltaproteobacteria bacterium]|nr:GDP-mannose 4,6-dehydratase [Deltaproteobacteria bacterium]